MAFTETFYVSMIGDGTLPHGSDPDHCFDVADFNTAANWDTDDAADDKIGPNDLVIFLAGTTFTGIGASVLTLQKSGLSGKPITIRGEIGQEVTIDGQDARQLINLEEIDYLTIENLNIIQGLNGGINAYDCDYITYRNLNFHDTFGTNLLHYGSHVLMEYCESYATDDEHGTYFFGPVAADDIIVQYCYFHGNHVNGLQLNTGSTRDTNVVIRYNWFEDNGWASLEDQSCDGAKIYGNIFVNTADYFHALLCDGDGVGDGPRNAFIYNNTFYGDFRSMVGLGTGGDPATGATVKNNIFYNTNGASTHYYIGRNTTSSTFTASNHNQFYNPSAPTDRFNWATGADATPDDLAEWQSVANLDLNSDEADPLFTNPAGGVFSLQIGSPCIDSGENLGTEYQYGLTPSTVKTDFGKNGSITLVNRNTCGAGWDIGAYEYAGGDPPDAPFSKDLAMILQ